MGRTCKTCRCTLPDSAFYESNKARCQECVKARARAHRQKNIEAIREYDRKRGLLPKRKEAVNRRRPRYVGKYRTFAQDHPLRRAAQVAVGNAKRDGLLVPQPCERCGVTEPIHAHHEDYSKPLDVTWLCPPCHGKRHREINEDARRASQDES